MGELAGTLSLRNPASACGRGFCHHQLRQTSRLWQDLFLRRLISRASSLSASGDAIIHYQVIRPKSSSTSMQAPSPKHGTIYRHPFILGTPKTLRAGWQGRWLPLQYARLDYNGSLCRS
jgi:hypothetical protein